MHTDQVNKSHLEGQRVEGEQNKGDIVGGVWRACVGRLGVRGQSRGCPHPPPPSPQEMKALRGQVGGKINVEMDAAPGVDLLHHHQLPTLHCSPAKQPPRAERGRPTCTWYKLFGFTSSSFPYTGREAAEQAV